MNELSGTVLKGFGLRADRAVREKAYYICATPDGPRMIYKSLENRERIIFQHEIKEHLYHAGFPWVDRYGLSEEGHPYVTYNGEHYVMTGYFERREPDFAHWPDLAQVLETTAHWHRAAREVCFSGDEKGFCQAVPLTAQFARQGSELEAIRKRVGRQARLSDFDVLFIKNAGYYARQIKNAVEALAKTNYSVWHTRALTHRHLCHNGLKEESLPMVEGRMYVTQYAEACVDLQLNDLCGLIRRHQQRAGVHAVPPATLLAVYHQIEPLLPESVLIIHALLQFPYHFMKIVTQYYRKKRTWTPNAITNRMLAAVSEREAYERYVQAYEGLLTGF